MSEIRATYSQLLILSHLERHSPDWVYGTEIMKHTALKSGTVYPALARFADRGWVRSRVEKGNFATLGRPVRVYYQLTPSGRKILREWRARF